MVAILAAWLMWGWGQQDSGPPEDVYVAPKVCNGWSCYGATDNSGRYVNCECIGWTEDTGIDL